VAGDDAGVKRRRPLRRLRSATGLAGLAEPSLPEPAVVPPPAASAQVPLQRPQPAVEPSFVCSTCRREMLLTERSRISLAKCRACV
jgi:hypothetical protein